MVRYAYTIAEDFTSRYESMFRITAVVADENLSGQKAKAILGARDRFRKSSDYLKHVTPLYKRRYYR